MPAAADIALVAAKQPALHSCLVDGVVDLALAGEASLGATALKPVRGLDRLGSFELG